MEGVDVGPGKIAGSDAAHGRPVAATPGVGKPSRVEIKVERGEFADEGAAPVDDGAKDIEGEDADVTMVHGAGRGRVVGGRSR